MTWKIGKPKAARLVLSGDIDGGKHAIWDALVELDADTALPVICSDRTETRHLSGCFYNHRLGRRANSDRRLDGITIRTEGRIVWFVRRA